MEHWRDRSKIVGDVVFFRYVTEGIERNTDEVFVWDLDKTYLDTKIETVGQLFMTMMERAFNKKNVPGTKALLRALSKTWKENSGHTQLPIYFITASPPQIESRIFEKFSFDGIRPFGCFYKDNLSNIQPRRWWRLTKQVGYKIQALLQLRLKLKDQVRQVMWGDDSESDAIIYNLYSDICARRLGPNELRQVLKSLSVSGDQIDHILHLQMQVPEGDPVEKIYINLAIDTDPDYYLKFGRRTLPTYNSFQSAVDLFQDGRMDLEGVLSVAQEMVSAYGFTPEEINRSFDELVRRHVLGETCVNRLLPFFIQNEMFPASYKPAFVVPKETKIEAGRVYELDGQFEPWVPARIDYQHDYR